MCCVRGAILSQTCEKHDGSQIVILLVALEERTVNFRLSASVLNPLVANSGSCARNQSGIYLKDNQKCEDKIVSGTK